MRLGAYTACLHDKPLKDALGILAALGLDSAEINSGGFCPRYTCRSRTCGRAKPRAASISACSTRPGWR